MNSDDAARWDARYRASGAQRAQPAQVLTEFEHLLPHRGAALEIACGLGGNALLLAARGLQTSAWDISAVAVERLAAAGCAAGLTLSAQVRDVVAAPPPAAGFDVIVVSRFLERALCPAIAAALRPGGLLYYQTFVRERVGDGGPRNPAFLLAPGELLRLFPGLDVLAYRDEGCVGDTSRGWRDEAYLVAQQPR